MVAGVGMVLGNVGTAYGLPAWLALVLGVAFLFLFLRLKGTKVSEEVEAEGA